MALRDEIRQQRRQSLEGKSLKEKLDYFWYYYKVHTIVALFAVVVIIIFIKDAMNAKDYAFSATLLNSFGSDIQEDLQEDFATYADIDTDVYTCYIDATSTLSYETMSQIDLAVSQRITAMAQTSGIDAFVSDAEPFINFSQSMMFMDLRKELTPEEYEKFEPDFFYIDNAVIDANNNEMIYDENGMPQIVDTSVDHSDPSAMKDPVPVGIYLRDSQKLKEWNCYTGNDDSPIFGFVYSSEHTKEAHLFLQYLTE